MSEPLEAEDAKLVTLARSARARVGAASGAALRDRTGRTYSGADVSLPSLAVSSLGLAVAQAAAAGADGVEAVAIVGADPSDGDLAAVRDLGGTDVAVFACNPDGSVRARLTT